MVSAYFWLDEKLSLSQVHIVITWQRASWAYFIQQKKIQKITWERFSCDAYYQSCKEQARLL